MIFEAGQRILFVGDSITDAGRARPVGQAGFGGLGNGYVSLVHAMITAEFPELGLKFINVGTSGNTVRDLRSRWQTDVLDLQPDWVFVMIGINDIWRQMDSPTNLDAPVTVGEYAATLKDLVTEAAQIAKGVFILPAFFMEPQREDPMRKLTDTFRTAAETVAAETGAGLIYVQPAFDRFLQHRHSASLAWDRVHPDPVGCMLIATEIVHTIKSD